MKYEEDVMEIDLLELVHAIKNKIVIIVITALIFAGVAGIYSFFIADPVYQSTSKLYIQTQGNSVTSLSDIQIGSTLALDCVEMIQSRSIAEEVIRELQLDITYKQLISKLSVTNPSDTRIVNISVEGTDPKQVTRIANKYADVAKVRISEVMKTDKPLVWESAVVPENPIKPEKTKNVVLAFLVGGMLACMVVVVLRLINDNIRTQDEIERYLELNLLAVIPYDEKENKDKNKKKSRRGKKGRKHRNGK